VATTTRALMTALLAVALSWSGVGATAQVDEEDAQPASGGGGDNAVVLINTKDGSSAFRLSLKIVRVNQDVVDQGNAAVAFASCIACRTVAVAVQVVLVFTDPSVVTPTNLAIAINFACTDCETLASAYQFVLGTDGNVHFSADGNRAIAEIRRELRDLLQAELPLGETQARLDELAARLRQVLADELVASGQSGVRVEERDEPLAVEPTPDPTQTPEERTTPTPTPEAASPSPEGTVSPTPSPSPTSSPSPAATVSPA
jgi:putative peptide zinc metalloprotease protein